MTPSLPSRNHFLRACMVSLMILPTTAFSQNTPYADWPMAKEPHDTVMGYGLHIRRGFGVSSQGREHSGIDLFFDGMDSSTAGKDVYAVSPGVVVCAPSNDFNPGKVIVVKLLVGLGVNHYMMYGHLESVLVQEGQVINRGDKIGTVFDDDANNNSHLHLELRTGPYWTGSGWTTSPVYNSDCLGPGYATTGNTAPGQGWLDPIEYYFTHRPPFTGATVMPDLDIPVRAQPIPSDPKIGQIPSGTSVAAHSVQAVAGTGWYYEVTYQEGASQGYILGFQPLASEPGQFGIHVGEASRRGTSCQCGEIYDVNENHITADMIYCDYQVCGFQGNVLHCEEDGWVNRGTVCSSTHIAMLDVAFAFDLTGSMSDDIVQVKARAGEIMNALARIHPNARGAVVGFKDYPSSPYGGSGDYTYRVFHPFSSDMTALAQSIQGLSVGGGGDIPESVYSGLYGAMRAQSLGGWRAGAEKIIILLGDAPPHDPEPYSPYLTFNQVVSAASSPVIIASEGMGASSVSPIKVFSILIGSNSQADWHFSRLSSATGGQILRAATAQDVVAAILGALGGSPSGGQGPVCTGATASPSTLWQPDHKMQNVQVAGVTDPDGGPVTISITGITQDEPVSGRGSGSTSPDGAGVGTSTAQVRAERSGKDDSRIYRVAFRASDATGHQCTGAVQVCVPHDRGENTFCVNQGQPYDSTRP